MSFRHSLDCFILRGREGNQILQRIQVRDTQFLKDRIAIPETIAGTWRVLRREFSISELPAVRKCNSWVRYTPLVLENSERPGTYYRIIYLWTLGMPRRGGLEVPTGCVLEGGAYQEFTRFVQVGGRMDWIVPDGIQVYPNLPYSVAYNVSYSVSTSSNILSRPAVPPVGQPVARPIPRPAVMQSIQALKPFVARVIAEAVRAKGEDCPITLDSMATCRKLYVPTCGHVCSDEACMKLEKCPVCRDTTAWTPIEFTV